MVSADSLDDVVERLRLFVAARDWERFHNPKNLAMALAGEAGELLAEFQWLTIEQSDAATNDPEMLKRVASEVADVAIYLLLLADRLGIDALDAISDKLNVNEARFPAVE